VQDCPGRHERACSSPRRVARAGPDTIGPLYHPTGCCCSGLTGLAVSDDLDPADLPDTPSQGAVMGPTVTRPPFTAAERPVTCFARHLPRAGPLPGNMWGCASVIGLCPTPFTSPSGVVGCRLASRANHCLWTGCSVHSVDTAKRSVLLSGCCICNSRRCDIMSQRQYHDTDESNSSSGEWDGLPSPMSYANTGNPSGTWNVGPKPRPTGTPDRIGAWGSPTGLSADELSRRRRVPVIARAGCIAPTDAACVTMSTLLILVRV